MAPAQDKRKKKGPNQMDALSAQLLQARIRADDLLVQAKANPSIKKLTSGLEEMSISARSTFTAAGQDSLDRGAATMDMFRQRPLSQSLRRDRAGRALGRPLRRVRSVGDVRGGADKAVPSRPHAWSPWAPLETIPSQELHHGSFPPGQRDAKFPSVAAPAVDGQVKQKQRQQHLYLRRQRERKHQQQQQQQNRDTPGRGLEYVASQLMAAPLAAVHSCQQTFENAQHNYKVLGEYLQNKAPPPMQKLLSGAPAGPGPSSRFTSSPALKAPPRTSSQGQMRSLASREGKAADDQESAQLSVAAIREAVGALQRDEVPDQRRRRDSREGSSLREPGRNVCIVTTASLPWMTGTAVNPLLRAAYLAREEEKRGESGSQVNLVIPWLAPADQSKVFPNGVTFATPAEQEKYVRSWATKRTGFNCNFKVTFYPGRYAIEKGSILPVGDPTQYISNAEADVAVLEEPEHLTWYHHGTRWTDKFNHVVGIMHTNYLDYARREEGGETKAKLLEAYNNWVCRVHCHKIVKLSDAVQPLPRQTTEFVHGVSKSFLAVGAQKALPLENGGERFKPKIYFMGKVLWAKGYTELVELMKEHRQREGTHPAIDCYGNGEDLSAVREVAKKQKLGLNMKGGIDHIDPSMHDYKVFINPSRSDVVATTTAEALAMGKWVIVQEHPSNEFFSKFKNCLTYNDPKQFSAHLKTALETDPHPMVEEEQRKLTWEDATQRFLDVASLQPEERANPMERGFDRAAWMLHNSLCSVEPLRKVAGAGINTRDNPSSLEQWEPSAQTGGWLDRKPTPPPITAGK